MDQILHTMDIYLTRFDKKLDAIVDYIKINLNSCVQSTLDTNFLGLFPLNDVESLINFNELLKTDKNSTKFVTKCQYYFIQYPYYNSIVYLFFRLI